MKRIFIDKPEPLLIVVPLILFLLYKIFPGAMVLDTSILFWGVFAFVIVPFLLHSLLRVSNKWDAVFCRPQVYLTLALLIIMFIAFYAGAEHAPVSGAYFKHTAGGKVIDIVYSSKIFAGIFLVELLVQFLFTIYFLIRIFQKAQ